MAKALITWGGWDGHEPDKVAALFAHDLRAAGMDVAVYDHLAPALSEGERWQGHAQAALVLGMNEGAVKVALRSKAINWALATGLISGAACSVPSISGKSSM